MSLRLASPPSLDVALLLMQGEHLEAVTLMVESGAVDLMELEELKIKIDVYAEIGSSTRIRLAPGTREKLHYGSVEVKQMIQAWREAQQDLVREINDDRT